MLNLLRASACVALSLVLPHARAAIHYVNLNNTIAVSPYTNWATAAKDIQTALDVAEAGDEVVVTNGVYNQGAMPLGLLTNRVAVVKPIVLRSVNGPAVTRIIGYQVPGTRRGPAAIRCVFLGTGATLAGFTLTNGATWGGASQFEDAGGGVFCQANTCIVSNCVIAGSVARWGGGAMQGVFKNCKFIENVGDVGGGAYRCALENCVLLNNSSPGRGTSGGGGGGAYECSLLNCAVTGNSATLFCGGAAYCQLTNCVVFDNSAPAGSENYAFGNQDHCCSKPLAQGPGNIDADPQLADAYHLTAVSPCRGAGRSGLVQGHDIDGEAWANPPPMGCDEYRKASSTGPLTVTLSATETNLNIWYAGAFQAQIRGERNAVRWEFGDGTVESNVVAVVHRWAAAGNYAVVVRAYNETFPSGVSATLMIQVFDEVHYVAVNSLSPLPPYNTWATAATTIQNAVDAIVAPGARVLVTNGVYEMGGRALDGLGFSRVAASQTVHLRSVNGPAVTIIRGGSEARCVALPADSSLTGFTLTNGNTSGDGGGIWCASSTVVSNCLVTGGSSAGDGGGVYRGIVYNTILTSNSARGGGGAHSSALYNCALIGNSAQTAGGAASSTLTHCTVSLNSGGGLYDGHAMNCILYHNAGYNYASSSVEHTCTTPLINGNDSGNIEDEPQLASASHLAATSPCRGAGALLSQGSLDIDGEPFNNPPSMGCDEYHDSPLIGPLTVSIQSTQTVVAPNYSLSFVGRVFGSARASQWEFGDGTGASNQLQVAHSWAADGIYPVVLRAFNEAYPDGVSATVTVQVVVHYVALDSPNPTPPYTSWATAARNIQDAVDAASEFRPLVLVSNGVYQTGGRIVSPSLLTNRVVIAVPALVRSVNGPEVTTIRGYQVPGTTNGEQAVRCVYLGNGAALTGFTLAGGATRTGPPYPSDSRGGGVWTGSPDVRLTNCVIRDNVAGIFGGGIYGPAGLVACTLIGNRAQAGGGADGGDGPRVTLERCIVAFNSAFDGGGVHLGGLDNCLVVSNSANGRGGGVYIGAIRNSTVTCNVAGEFGGGIRAVTSTSSIIYDNTAPKEPNYSVPIYPMQNTCTVPMITVTLVPELHNFTNAPLFVAPASGNFRLQIASPCIDAGLSSEVQVDTDLDGSSRIYGGSVDVGAYEFRPPAAYHDWLQSYGLPTDGTADRLDSDLDHAYNWQEWFAGTSPIDSGSLLRLFPPTFHKDGISITWQSVTGRVYSVERSTNAQTFEILQRALNGQAGTMTLVDPEPLPSSGVLYRVGAQ